MAITINFPELDVAALDVAALALKDILENLGIAPIILQHWKITIEENHARWCYEITLSWRAYKIRRLLDKDELSMSQTGALQHAARFIAYDLWAFNIAEDEEHMEALVLLSMRPTNVPQDQQL